MNEGLPHCVRGGEFLLQPRYLRLKRTDLGAQGVGLGQLGAALLRCEALQ